MSKMQEFLEAQEFLLKRKDFEERKKFGQNARILSKMQEFLQAQEFPLKRKDFSRKRKKFRGNARRKKARNPTATCACSRQIRYDL